MAPQIPNLAGLTQTLSFMVDKLGCVQYPVWISQMRSLKHNKIPKWGSSLLQLVNKDPTALFVWIVGFALVTGKTPLSWIVWSELCASCLPGCISVVMHVFSCKVVCNPSRWKVLNKHFISKVLIFKGHFWGQGSVRRASFFLRLHGLAT